MMAVITNSFSNVVFSFYGSKFQKDSRGVVGCTSVLYCYDFWFRFWWRYAWIHSRCYDTSDRIILHTPLYCSHWLVMFFAIVKSSIVFHLPGLSMASTPKASTRCPLSQHCSNTTYLSVEYSIVHLLPSPWQEISHFNPVLYIINGFRYGFLGSSDINVWYSALTVLGMAAIFFVGQYIYSLAAEQ